MLKWAYHLCLALLLLSSIALEGMVPPHPRYQNPPANWQAIKPERKSSKSENMAASVENNLQQTRLKKDSEELPNNILALMVQFSDKHFKTALDYPDSLNHDEVFFDRWMLHLREFYSDASHGRYVLNYTVYPQVLTLPHPMSWYGNDSDPYIDKKLPSILQDLMPLCDDQIDFNAYGGLVIFHAGAGQETDIESIRNDNIWSTFLTRKALQETYDPDNDDYPGFTTGDGAILKNVVIVPEDQYQDYFPGPGEEDADLYLFSIYGVLVHQFGHILGLPTLFDNFSANGSSQGIGNWGLMGTGVWNASGYVPAQLSAWCRYYLGWEDAITLEEDTSNVPLDHFLNHQDGAIRLYKVPISDTEYFLIENRQQNPDGSLDPYNNLPSYSFKLLPEGIQDYYENFPELPYFNIMENSYQGCEWDFFLPGYGMSPHTDGSGILIWHIDENVIASHFSQDFDDNSVNGNQNHKGVDLEEADGYQHLDTSIMSDYKYGGPDDSFRAGNNDYFGDGTHQSQIWLPTSESYYGGVPLEIYDISESGNRMHFSLRFAWKLDVGYNSVNTLPAAALDLDGDGQNEIFYPMPSGKLAMFDAEVWADEFPIQIQDIPYMYTWDGSRLYIPTQSENLVRLFCIDGYYRNYVLNLPSSYWLSHPVDGGNELYLPLWDESEQHSQIRLYNKDLPGSSQVLFSQPAELLGNLSLSDSLLYALVHYEGEAKLNLLSYPRHANIDQNYDLWPIDVPADSSVVGIYTARLRDKLNLIVQCSSSIYVFDLQAESPMLAPGFPVVVADSISAPINLADIDGNGSLDMLWASSYRLYIIDYGGNDLAVASHNLGLADDGISAGVLAMDLDGDSNYELASAMNFNRLAVWEENYRLKRGYPVSFGSRGRHLPFVTPGSDQKYYLWQATDRGQIYRSELPDYEPVMYQPHWSCEYGNLQRTANYPLIDLPNQYLSEEVFVQDETYIFPNPLKSYYEQKLRLSVMPTQDLEVELKIFDIRGKLLYQKSALAFAYLHNTEIFEIPAHKLSSGIYIALVKGGNKTLQLRFGVEK